MVSDRTVTRPAFRYYGGKWNLGKWVNSYSPDHESYLEPCFGAGSVLLQKERSKLETVGDIDGNIVNFFAVLRDYPDELIRMIRFTPWARDEYEFCRRNEPKSDSPIENARRFWFSCYASIAGMGFSKSGFRTFKNVDSASNSPGSVFCLELDHLYAAAERMRGVQIENKPYNQLIAEYDHKKCLIYFDPPYIKSTRHQKNQYHYEWDNDDHIEAAGLLTAVKGDVIISGYAHPLYADLYESRGWVRIDREATTNGGGKRVESIWIKPETWGKLEKYQKLNGYNQLGF